MFPVGLVFMLKAYKASNNLSVILSTSVVAATIKLSNILLPGTSPLDVFNPAIASICESLAVFVLFSLGKCGQWYPDLPAGEEGGS
jgi:hypothetical protein